MLFGKSYMQQINVSEHPTSGFPKRMKENDTERTIIHT
jgi:hypothetical protein